MSIFDFFFGRSQNESKNRRGIKLNRRAVRTRNLAMEPLETRDLLSVTTGLIDDSAYAELRAQYPEFNLPATQSTLNVMTVECNLADLKSAINQAKSSSQSDLILVKTTNSANTITYSSSSDEITINASGSITIIGWGTKVLTLNANQKCRVMTISGTTDANLGNLTITKGKISSSSYGGGIYSASSGKLILTNCTISNNIVINESYSTATDSTSYSYGGGIYSSSVLTLINCAITNNSTFSKSSTSYDYYNTRPISYSYGGGIYSNKGLTMIDCVIANNSAKSTSSPTTSSQSYTYGGGIYSKSSVSMTNCTIENNSASAVTYKISSTNSSYSDGGGIYITSSGSLSLIGCNIIGNSLTGDTKSGAAIHMQQSKELSVINSIITSESDVPSNFDVFGDILLENSSLNYATVSISGGNSWLVLNSSIVGTSRDIGISVSSGDLSSNLTVSNSLICGFDKGINTSAVLNVDIVNSTITDNTYGVYATSSSAVYNIYNTIIAQNKSDVYKSGTTINAYNTLSSYKSWTSGSDNIRYDISTPLFLDGKNNNYYLADNSQAINKGNNSFTVDIIDQPLVTDLAGNPRIIGSTVDLGAYESYSFITSAIQTPSAPTLSAEDTTITATWSPVTNASFYTVEYQPDGFDGWYMITGIQGTSTYFTGTQGTTYNVRVKANGSGDYSDSDYSAIESITLTVPATPITGISLSNNSPIVGSTITVSLIPTDATADYQWFSGETLIEGATGSTFIVTEDQIGQTITCVATGTGDYTGTVIMTTAVVPVPVTVLDAPADVALSVYNATVTASWSAVENASSYTLEYKPVDAENWTALPGLEDTTASFVGVSGTMYNVRVKAVGTGDYSDSTYAEINTDKPTGPVVAINANKVTVSWVDDSPAADAVRYRVAGTTRWTLKKLKAGITELSFNATIGTNYDIEVLLDQQENNVLQGSAIVLDQPKLTSIRNELKDDTFQVNVTNYAAKNLAANVKQAIVSVNGVMTTLKIADQQGETALANGGKVAFSNGLFTFSEMNSNTSYKVMISFSDGHSVSKTSSALTVKTLKAPYLPPVIVSANAVSDTSITVTWETAYGKKSTTPAQKYTVQYSTDGNKWTNATTGATGNSYTIQRLKGGVEYQVRVLATKDAAFEASAPSGVLSAQTLTLPKTVLDKASVKDDTFKLDVTNYATSNLVNAPTLNVKSDKFGEAAIAIQNGSGSATFENGMVAAFENGALTFTNVPSNTQQKIQVNFSDGVCTTAWTAALTVKTTIAPYNKPVLTNATATSSTTVLVEWDAVTGKNSTVLAPSYTVQYTTDGTRWINANTRVVGTSFTIPNLKPNTSYRVAVIANKDARFNASQPSESWESENACNLPFTQLIGLGGAYGRRASIQAFLDYLSFVPAF